MAWQKQQREFVPDYCIVARLKIVDREFWIDGAVLRLSPQSALFRESTEYLLKRQNEEAVLEIESVEYRTRIASTDQYGYQLEFFDTLPDALVSELCDRWRIEM